MERILLLLLCISFSVSAQLKEIPLAERAANSDFIIEGTVLSKRSFWNADRSMIYTGTVIQVFKVFKGEVSSENVEILTEGGVAVDKMIVVNPSLTLNKSDAGVFLCKYVKRFKLAPEDITAIPQFEVYASVQGFIKYDLNARTASDPFRKYSDIENEVYGTLLDKKYGSYKEIKSFEFFTQNVMAIGTISGFYPSSVSAGTGNVLTITGHGFGEVRDTGIVQFANASDGGATYVSALPSQYNFWSDTLIRVEVPASAGTGVIRVVPGNTITSAAELTVTYAHTNIEFDPGTGIIAYQTDLVSDNGTGGYTWRMNSRLDQNAPARQSIARAFSTWRCYSGVNWLIGSTTPINEATNDGVNVIAMDDLSLHAEGVGAICYSYWSGCASGATIIWFVSEIDLVLDERHNIAPYTWQYGPAAPSASEYDMESAVLRQLGIGHQLEYVNDTSAVMHYEFLPGKNKRILSVNDLAGADFVHTKSIDTNICGPAPMIGFVCNRAPTDITLTNASVDENNSPGTIIGLLGSVDPDAGNTFQYSLVTGTGDQDNTFFSIDNGNLKILVSADYELKNSYSVRIKTTDQGGLMFEKNLVITINNVNENPTDILLTPASVNENVNINTVVGLLTALDPDEGDVSTFSLAAGVGDEDNVSFYISGNELKISVSPDYEQISSYSIRIKTTDHRSLTFEEVFIITVNDVAEIISIQRTSAEYSSSGTVTFQVNFEGSITDVDVSDFSLTTTGVSGASLNGVTGSGATYLVSVNTGAGDGTIRLDLTNPTGITPNASSLYSEGEVYIIDKTAPSVVISSTASDPTNISPIVIEIDYSENVVSFTAFDVGVTGGTITDFSGGGSSYSVEVTPGGNGIVTVSVGSFAAQDIAGNYNSAAPLFSIEYKGSTTGVQTESGNSLLKIYPNPSTGSFFISFNSNGRRQTIKVMNAVSHAQFEYIIEQADGECQKLIDLSGFPKGIYFLTIESEEGIVSRKIIVE